MKSHVHALVAKLSARELAFAATEFLAPVVRGGRVRVCVAGLVHPCAVTPPSFSGWGVFRVTAPAVARVIRRAGHPAICAYLERLALHRVRLAQPLARGSWFAVPLHGAARPVEVHLVHGAQVMDVVRCRCDGAVHWFEEVDRTSDPVLSQSLRTALSRGAAVETLALPALSPDVRGAYAVAQRSLAPRDAQTRLSAALRTGGGSLRAFDEQSGCWNVAWTDRNGGEQRSLVSKTDLTVVSAGICLSGQDRDFDLTSLVGVVTGED